jgi:hypothetical protein
MPLLAFPPLALFVMSSQSTVEISTGYLSRQRPHRRDIKLSESQKSERYLEVNVDTSAALSMLL